MINVKFNKEEQVLLKRLDIPYAEVMDCDEAEKVLDIADELQSMNNYDRNIAEDIITKITTHPDW